MAKNKSFWITFLIFFVTVLPLHAQQISRYIVHFTDKDSTPFSIERPEEFLSQRAIERREKQQIVITERDLPVNPSYVSALKNEGVPVFYTSRWFNAALIETDSATSEQLLALDFIREVELVAPGSRLTPSKENQKSGTQNHFQIEAEASNLSMNTQNEMLGADHLHSEGFTGEDMLIAICDGGYANVDNLPIFSRIYDGKRMLATYNFTDNSPNVYTNSSHGTQSLSCIGAYEEGVAIGVAYDADFMLFVTEETATEYPIEEYNWLFAAEYADSAGVDVINTSLGYSTFDDTQMDHTYEDMDGNTTVITRAADFAAQRGMLVVVSAGNEGSGEWYYMTAPADADSVLTVGAVTKAFQKASFSSYGPTSDGRIKPDVSALGFRTVVGSIYGGLTESNGTSFSAPQIAGLAAITWQKYPALNNMEVIEQIKLSGHAADQPNNEIGYGVPNFYRDENDIYLGTEMLDLAEISIFPNPVRDGKVYLKGHQSLEEVQVAMYNTTGQAFHLEPQVMSDRTILLDISALNPGVYFLKISTPKSSQTVKVLKF
jgi:serine protease AprX